MKATPKKPLVLACSGASFAGRLAYDLARELDRRGIAEMTCLAGFGAAKPVFLKRAAGREVWVIDACPIECGLGIFDNLGIAIDRHIRLADLGIAKHKEPPGGVNLDALVAAVTAAAAAGARATG